MKIGFDNEKYLKMQSEHIRERIGQFDNKLYLEFGGKLLMISMPPEFFLDSSLTANSVCYASCPIRPKSSSSSALKILKRIRSVVTLVSRMIPMYSA